VGFLYLAVVLDAFSRRIVGWAMETHLRTELVLKALDLALRQRRPAEVLHHSDQGSQGEFKRSSQHPDRGIAMTRQKRRSDWCGRAASRSPGRPPMARRENYRRFWALIAAGRSTEDAAIDAGVSPAVGGRWFRRAGGMPPFHFSQSSKPLSGRYLSFAEREEIAILPRPAAADWDTGPPPHNGMLIVRCAVPKQPSWRGMKRYAITCRTGFQGRSLRLTE
jgi:hypothetical protein